MSERARSLIALAVIALSLAIVAVVLTVDAAGDGDRVEALASRLKCPVCTSESVADSPAQVSRDLYVLIEEQVAAGWSDNEVVAFFVARYGEEALLDPPARGPTTVLWIAPLVALAFGAALVAGRRSPAPETLSEVDRALVERTIEDLP